MKSATFSLREIPAWRMDDVPLGSPAVITRMPESRDQELLADRKGQEDQQPDIGRQRIERRGAR